MREEEDRPSSLLLMDKGFDPFDQPLIIDPFDQITPPSFSSVIETASICTTPRVSPWPA